ncbi:MAG: hypothetical protein HKN70_08135 [Gammaproteobacteria bacterium]|nr:hypothetical protein [Gammaproteobacteria bacterium]
MQRLLPRAAAVLLLTAFVADGPLARADESQCIAAVTDKHYERLSAVCIELPHRDRLKKMQLLMSGQYTHYLGTIEQPSDAFTALKQLATDGDHQAQYMYGLLYSTVHFATDYSWPSHPANDGKVSLEQFNDRIRAEADFWARKAVSGGHTLAMLDVAENILRQSFADESADLAEALQLARQARAENPRLARDLISRIHKRTRDLKAGSSPKD